jgi:hypothetical protein
VAVGFTTTYAISAFPPDVVNPTATNKTDLHDITETLLKVALNTIGKTNKQTNKQTKTSDKKMRNNMLCTTYGLRNICSFKYFNIQLLLT